MGKEEIMPRDETTQPKEIMPPDETMKPKKILKPDQTMHPVYRVLKDSKSDLCQGDIIDADRLKPALKGHQDYMAQRPDFRSFCVMTQTCDLVLNQKPAEYITLAVIRLLKKRLRER